MCRVSRCWRVCRVLEGVVGCWRVCRVLEGV